MKCDVLHLQLCPPNLNPRPQCTHSLQDTFNRPICSAPDAWFDVMERTPVNSQE